MTTMLANAFSADGHKVLIVSFRHQEGTNLLGQLLSGCEWKELPSAALNSEENLSALTALFEDFRPDVVVFQDSYTDIHYLLFRCVSAAKLDSATKILCVEHNEPLGTLRQRYEDPLWKAWCRTLAGPALRLMRQRRGFKIGAERRKEIARSVDRYIVLSRHYVPMVKRMLGNELAAKVFAVPNPMNAIPPNALNTSDKRKLVVFVGTLSITKGVDRMLKAWCIVERHVPEWRFSIVGDGNQRTRLEEFVRKNKLQRVDFMGALTDPSIIMRKASIFLSASDYEGWPMTICEAMSCGCATVAFDSFGAVRDMIDDGVEGLLIKPFHIRMYAKAMVELMTDDYRRKGMSLAAREKSLRYSLEAIKKKWYVAFGVSRPLLTGE